MCAGKPTPVPIVLQVVPQLAWPAVPPGPTQRQVPIHVSILLAWYGRHVITQVTHGASTSKRKTRLLVFVLRLWNARYSPTYRTSECRAHWEGAGEWWGAARTDTVWPWRTGSCINGGSAARLSCQCRIKMWYVQVQMTGADWACADTIWTQKPWEIKSIYMCTKAHIMNKNVKKGQCQKQMTWLHVCLNRSNWQKQRKSLLWILLDLLWNFLLYLSICVIVFY